jgi:hypothetical protein
LFVNGLTAAPWLGRVVSFRSLHVAVLSWHRHQSDTSTYAGWMVADACSLKLAMAPLQRQVTLDTSVESTKLLNDFLAA